MTFQPKIAVIGLGYVGLPLSIEFAKFFDVLGYDKNPVRVLELKKLKDKTDEANIKELKVVLNEKLKLSSSESDLKGYNIYIITVPTPINDD